MLRFFFLLVILPSAWSCAASTSDEVDTNDVGMPLPQSPESSNTPSTDSDDVSTAPQMETSPGTPPAEMSQMQPMPDGPFSFPENMASRFAESVCAYLNRCDAENKLATLLEAVLNEECATYVENQYAEQTLARLLEPVRTGEVNFDQVAAETCISGFALLDCSFSLDNLPEACRFAFRGTVAPGDACTVAEACPDEHSCTTAESCPGVCTPWADLGEPCNPQLACKSGLVCFEGTCSGYGLQGATCGENHPPCDSGPPLLACDAQPTEEGVCEVMDQAAAADGSNCSPLIGPFCGDGLACVIETPDPLGGRCRPLQVEGERCRIAIPDQCQSGTYCEGIDPDAPFFQGLEGDCRALPQEGSACGDSLLGGACARGTICLGNTCGPRQTLGQECTEDIGCYTGVCVNGQCGFPGACGQ